MGREQIFKEWMDLAIQMVQKMKEDASGSIFGMCSSILWYSINNKEIVRMPWKICNSMLYLVKNLIFRLFFI